MTSAHEASAAKARPDSTAIYLAQAPIMSSSMKTGDQRCSSTPKLSSSRSAIEARVSSQVMKQTSNKSKKQDSAEKQPPLTVQSQITSSTIESGKPNNPKPTKKRITQRRSHKLNGHLYLFGPRSAAHLGMHDGLMTPTVFKKEHAAKIDWFQMIQEEKTVVGSKMLQQHLKKGSPIFEMKEESMRSSLNPSLLNSDYFQKHKPASVQQPHMQSFKNQTRVSKQHLMSLH